MERCCFQYSFQSEYCLDWRLTVAVLGMASWARRQALLSSHAAPSLPQLATGALGANGCPGRRTQGGICRNPEAPPAYSLVPAFCPHQGLIFHFPSRQAEQPVFPLAAASVFLLFHFQPWQPHILQAGGEKKKTKPQNAM